jgi:plastocyanin
VTRPRSWRPARGLAVLAVVLTALTACGGDDGADAAATTSAAAPSETSTSESTPAEAGESRTLTATEGEMFIELSSEELGAGSYTIEVVNEGSATHDFVVERDGSDVAATDSLAPGASATLTVDLEPGEYVFYCSVANHRAMGMEVTVTVT